MQKKIERLRLPEGVFNVEVLAFSEQDHAFLSKIYRNWRNLCGDLALIEARGINLPEGLSESAFCIEMGAVRVIRSIPGANSSWDCYDINRKKRIQVKACSVLPDLTSFGPESQWDEIYFLDFYREGKWDGTFNIYLIPNRSIYEYPVNRGQTMREQQEQRRRPRFSIYSGIIEPQKIRPIKTGRLF